MASSTVSSRSSRFTSADENGAEPLVREIVIVGELNVDFILHNYEAFPAPGREVLVESFQMVLGSASAICAIGLARLGARVIYVSRVGDDPWGAFCLDTLARAGIDVSRVVRDARITTGITVSISSPTERALVTYPGSIAAQTLAHLESFDFGVTPRHLHVSSYFLQSGLRPGCAELFARASAAGWTTSLDPGCDPADCWGPDLLPTLSSVDIFLPNEVELRGVAGVDDPAEALRRLENGRTRTVAKLGLRGAMALEHGKPIEVAPPPVDARDTTGAGDSFNAGFLYSWLNGQPLRASLRAGTICGALSTRGIGGTAAQATREELESCLANAS